MLPILVATALVIMPGQTGSDSPDDSLIGIWASRTEYRPAELGPLTVQRRGTQWSADLGATQGSVEATGDSIRIVFPGGGRFRGVMAGPQSITGFWLQPSGVIDGRPNAAYRQPFATPLVLERAGTDSWRGRVRQLPESFTLYLRIFRDTAGALVGAFRNHDFGSNGGVSLFQVARTGDSVHLTFRYESEPEIRHSARLLQSPDRLRLYWRDVGTQLELVRLSPTQAASFFPRPPGERYRYRQPPQTGDGWDTAPAREVGLDPAALAVAVQRIIDTNPAIRGAPLMHSMLVARRGKLVMEEYFHGYDRDMTHDMRSAGKTFASVMLGAVMREGVRVSPETRLYQLLGGMGPFANADPRKDRITLAHLMTHTAGLACDDYNDDSPGNENRLEQVTSDWYKYTLDLPMAHEPGHRYAYCSANTNLMGAALTTATTTWLPELFARTVARPLQFGVWHWNLMPNGQGYLGGGSWLRPRDLLKIGQAYLDGGVWKGRRIVDSAWIAISTASRIKITPATTGLSEEDFGNSYGGGEDGYAWHLGGDQYFATGNGGQLLIVAPKQEMVVVFTGANYRQGWIWGRWGPEFVGKHFIPAIRD
jgi:CubicO group peptidase (beta-lactamase class C family)